MFILVGLGIVGGVGLIVVEILYHKHKVWRHGDVPNNHTWEDNDMMICGNTNERFKKKGKSRRTQVRRERRAEAAKDAISRWKGTIEVTNWQWIWLSWGSREILEGIIAHVVTMEAMNMIIGNIGRKERLRYQKVSEEKEVLNFGYLRSCFFWGGHFEPSHGPSSGIKYICYISEKRSSVPHTLGRNLARNLLNVWDIFHWFYNIFVLDWCRWRLKGKELVMQGSPC